MTRFYLLFALCGFLTAFPCASSAFIAPEGILLEGAYYGEFRDNDIVEVNFLGATIPCNPTHPSLPNEVLDCNDNIWGLAVSTNDLNAFHPEVICQPAYVGGTFCPPMKVGLFFGFGAVTPGSTHVINLNMYFKYPIYGCCDGELVATQTFTVVERQNNYTVKLFPQAGSPESSTTLTSVEPGKDAALVAQVFNQNNQLVPNVGVKIEADVVMNTGGHMHHDSQRPKGKLNNQDPPIITGSTGAGGFSFTFKAPAPAGDHILKATCTDRTCTQQGPDRVWVGVKDLVPLQGAPLYALVGSDADHPDNHYLTNSALGQVAWLTQLYRERFPNDPVLHLNDASLERGGLFDIQYPGRGTTWWTPPHKTHRFGVEIDIRANNAPGAIPAANFKEFRRLYRGTGATTCPSAGPGYINTSNQHYHVCLMGGDCCQGGNR